MKKTNQASKYNKSTSTKDIATDKTGNKPVSSSIDKSIKTVEKSIENKTKGTETEMNKPSTSNMPKTNKNITKKQVNTPVNKTVKTSESTVDNSSAKKNTLANKSAKEEIAKKPEEKPTKKTNNTQKQNTSAKNNSQKTQPNQIKMTTTKVESPQKSNKGLVLGALLLGAAGTVLGAYSYTELQKLKSLNSEQIKADLVSGIQSSINEKITSLQSETKANITQLNSTISKNVDSFNATITTTNETTKNEIGNLSKKLIDYEASFRKKLENIQKLQEMVTPESQRKQAQVLMQREKQIVGLIDKLKKAEAQQNSMAQQAVKQAMSTELTSLNKLMTDNTSKFNQMISAGTAKISTNVAQKTKEIALNEVAYLLKLANSESKNDDVNGATNLLMESVGKLADIGDAKFAPVLSNMQAKLSEYKAIKPINIAPLIAQLKSLDGLVMNLLPKQSEKKAVEKKSEPAGAFNSALNIIKSGIKFTPTSEKINKSKTSKVTLQQKKLVLADLKMAETALQSKDVSLLTSSLTAAKNKINTNFAVSIDGKTLWDTIEKISKTKIKTNMSDLSGIVSNLNKLISQNLKGE